MTVLQMSEHQLSMNDHSICLRNCVLHQTCVVHIFLSLKCSKMPTANGGGCGGRLYDANASAAPSESSPVFLCSRDSSSSVRNISCSKSFSIASSFTPKLTPPFFPGAAPFAFAFCLTESKVAQNSQFVMWNGATHVTKHMS